MPYSVYPLRTDDGDDPGARVATIILWLLQVLYTPEGTEIAEIINERLRDLAAHQLRPAILATVAYSKHSLMG